MHPYTLPEDLDKWDDINLYFIRPCEVFWVEHQPWLEEQGYSLRPRYHPDWIPSWIQDPSKPVRSCEDAASYFHDAPVMDAVYIPDGTHVMLKALNRDRNRDELAIGRVLEGVPDDPQTQILVMPSFRELLHPGFETIGEIGLQFMHKHRVAHRDCTLQNIVMDGRPLFSEPWHPVWTYKSWDYSRRLGFHTRTQRPVKYYFIDFGIAKRYTPEQCPPLEPIHLGIDRTVPEFQGSSLEANPFPTDVYYIGNMIRKWFLQGSYRVYGLEVVEPLINDMVQDDPTKRPTMDEVVKRFGDIRTGLSTSQLRGRAIKQRTLPIVVFFRSFGYWARRIRFAITRVPAVPVPI
ncbi:hypothetical protein C8R46DRAFT_1222303 [Mycena filopes]|nr:hypothetical protein C8R46DRAFT_1222303 [Mycena filopes]